MRTPLSGHGRRSSFRLGEARSRRGITFIEMMVAALILAVGLMSLMNVWIFSYGITRRSDEVAIAYNLARLAMERARAAGYYYADGATLQDSKGNLIAGAYDANGDRVGAPYYNLSIIVTTGSDMPSATEYLNLKQVDAIVTRVSDGQVIAQTSSFLTLGGI